MTLNILPRTKIGILPVAILIAVVWVSLGWNFPGYCDRGDGLRCTGPGILGLADHILGIRSGGPFAGIALIIFGIGLLLFLTIWSWIAMIIYRIPKIGKGALVLIYALVAVLFVTWARGIVWQPQFVGDSWRGYMPASTGP